jgi:hypothetical protein
MISEVSFKWRKHLKDDFFQNFCEQVLNLDSHIRFVGMAGADVKLLGYSYRKRADNQMTDRELEKSMIPLIIQVQLYNKVKAIAGELRYHIGTFERLYAASIPIKFNPKEKFTY